MPLVSCPTCGEKGRIPGHFIGNRVKCAKCGNSFTLAPPAPRVQAAAVSPGQSALHGEFIEVEGLEPGGWLLPESPPAGAGPATASEARPAELAASPAGEAPGAKQYKLLTRKDPWFAGKFDLERLEEALNHYARQGWAVRSMATPHIPGFSGEAREEIVVLLER